MPEHFQVTDTAELEPGRRNKKLWVNFKPDLDLGHILAMLTFLGALALQWQIIDRRITILEQRAAIAQEQAADTKGDIKEIKTVVNKLATDMAVSNAMNARKQ